MPDIWKTPTACPSCGELRPEWDQLLGDKEREILSLVSKVTNREGQITKLRNQMARQPEANPFYVEALTVFEYWKHKLCPGAREFNGGRMEKVLERLEGGATVEEMKAAIDGIAASDWHQKRGRHAHRDGKRQFELHLICRDEPHLLQYQALAAESAESTNGAGAAAASAPAPKEVTRLRDRCERLEKEKRELQDRVAEQEQAAVNWRASFHEALDYLSICNKSLAITADDSNTQRFTVATA